MQKNKLIPVPYQQVAQRLALALVDYDPSDEISAGRAKTYLYGETAVLLRIEGSELVVVGLVGEIIQTSLFIYTTALQTKGIKTLRFHTMRKGMKRALISAGIPVYEQGIDNENYQILGVNCGR